MAVNCRHDAWLSCKRAGGTEIEIKVMTICYCYCFCGEIRDLDVALEILNGVHLCYAVLSYLWFLSEFCVFCFFGRGLLVTRKAHDDCIFVVGSARESTQISNRYLRELSLHYFLYRKQ